MVAWLQLSLPVVTGGEVAQVRNRTSARTSNYRHFVAGLRFADLWAARIANGGCVWRERVGFRHAVG